MTRTWSNHAAAPKAFGVNSRFKGLRSAPSARASLSLCVVGQGAKKMDEKEFKD